jgi:hypothetical protein
MSEKIQKFISIKQICTDCQLTFYKDAKILDVAVDFKISDVKNQLKAPPNHCPECKKQVDATFSFHHEEKLTK